MEKNRREMIVRYIETLSRYIGNPRPPIPLAQLMKIKKLHAEKKYRDAIIRVHDTLNLQYLNLSIFFTIVDNIPKHRCALMAITRLGFPKKFQQSPITIYAKYSFVNTAPPETFIRIAAHEWSHVVINAPQDKKHIVDGLENIEVAVDLTAMMLGYREIFCIGNTYTRNMPVNFFTFFECARCTEIKILVKTFLRFLGFYITGQKTVPTYWQAGYLSTEEIQFATVIMDNMILAHEKKIVEAGP